MHNPFKKVDIPLSSPSENQQGPPKTAPPSEDELFSRAMQDVAPLHGKGREVAPPPLRSSRSVTPATNNSFRELLEKSIEFDLESTHEYIQGYIRGLDQKTFRKLKAGSFSVEAHLDLHGHTLDQARISFLDFMRDTYLQGIRCVLLIPGRGKNSPLGTGILRQGVQSWLTRDPVKRIVLAFCTAQPRHGGAGAVYVLLRKNKKGQGKIFWDKILFDKH